MTTLHLPTTQGCKQYGCGRGSGRDPTSRTLGVLVEGHARVGVVAGVVPASLFTVTVQAGDRALLMRNYARQGTAGEERCRPTVTRRAP